MTQLMCGCLRSFLQAVVNYFLVIEDGYIMVKFASPILFNLVCLFFTHSNSDGEDAVY